MTTLFISDLHLDDQRPAATGMFLDFLQDEARNADALYILGDLFEYWLGDDAPTPTGQRAGEALATLTRAGLPVYFLHGNRDFLIRNDFARMTGVSLLNEETVIDLYGQPTLLLHGDTLCTDDTGYQKWRKILRDPAWQDEFLLKTPQERIQFALQAREMSADYKEGVAMEIMDVNQDAVQQAFERNGVQHMIHGHTHRPAVHQHEWAGGSGERIVLGDWYEQGSVLRVTPSGNDLARLLPADS